MTNHDTYFPNRYEKSRTFLERLNNLVKHKSKKQLFEDEFQMRVQDFIWDEMIQEQKKLPTHLLLNQNALESKLEKELNFYWFYQSWNTNGRSIFHFTKELLDMFSNSSVDDIPISVINFPYDCMYFSFQELDSVLGMDTLGSEVYLDGVFVVRDLCLPNRIDIFLNTYLKGQKISKHWTSSKYATLYGEWFRLKFENPTDTIRDVGFHAQFSQSKTANGVQDGLSIFFSQVIDVILNSLCYISSKIETPSEEWPSDTPISLLNKLKNVKNERQKDLVLKELKQQGYSKIKFLGNNFKQNHQPENNLTISTHWRRGHWRNQPTGQNLSDNKLIWIKPTIVNKDKGEATKGKIYEV